MAHEITSGFTPAECETLRSEDRDAAAHIVGLMVGIFLVGVVMYLWIAYCAA